MVPGGVVGLVGGVSIPARAAETSGLDGCYNTIGEGMSSMSALHVDTVITSGGGKAKYVFICVIIKIVKIGDSDLFMIL